MEEDEVKRPVDPMTNPIAYAFEPSRRGNRAVARVEKVVEPERGSEERIANTTWCQCGCCMPMPTV